jgi:hypothetical protein
MGNAFEEARRHGYSEADMAAEMKETEDRMAFLGCMNCKYIERNCTTCNTIINDDMYQKCPYRKNKEV